MRLTKMFGLAALTAVAAMAIVGATSASALNTELCNSHSALTCSSAATGVKTKLEAGTVAKLLSSLATILCLEAGFSATPLALGNPQLVHFLTMVFAKCGTNMAHTNCTVEVLELPLALLLKTGLDEGTLTFDSGRTLKYCENVFFGIDIHCEYDMAGTSFAVGAQKLTSNKVPVSELGNLELCPSEMTLDGTFVMTENRYVLQ